MSASPQCDGLPNGEDEQDRGKDDVDQRVRYQDDAETDDDERHQNEWGIDFGSILDLLAIQSDDDRHVDGFYQPCHLDHQAGGHKHQIVMDKGAYNHDGNGEDEHGQCHNEDGAFLAEFFGAETFGEQPSEEYIAQDGTTQNIDQHKDAGKHHDRTSPF